MAKVVDTKSPTTKKNLVRKIVIPLVDMDQPANCVERLFFMKHMLRICPVAVLRESTQELKSKVPSRVWDILNDIYFIRGKQERFEDGGIGKSLKNS